MSSVPSSVSQGSKASLLWEMENVRASIARYNAGDTSIHSRQIIKKVEDIFSRYNNELSSEDKGIVQNDLHSLAQEAEKMLELRGKVSSYDDLSMQWKKFCRNHFSTGFGKIQKSIQSIVSTTNGGQGKASLRQFSIQEERTDSGSSDSLGSLSASSAENTAPSLERLTELNDEVFRTEKLLRIAAALGSGRSEDIQSLEGQLSGVKEVISQGLSTEEEVVDQMQVIQSLQKDITLLGSQHLEGIKEKTIQDLSSIAKELEAAETALHSLKGKTRKSSYEKNKVKEAIGIVNQRIGELLKARKTAVELLKQIKEREDISLKPNASNSAMKEKEVGAFFMSIDAKSAQVHQTVQINCSRSFSKLQADIDELVSIRKEIGGIRTEEQLEIFLKEKEAQWFGRLESAALGDSLRSDVFWMKGFQQGLEEVYERFNLGKSDFPTISMETLSEFEREVESLRAARLPLTYKEKQSDKLQVLETREKRFLQIEQKIFDKLHDVLVVCEKIFGAVSQREILNMGMTSKVSSLWSLSQDKKSIKPEERERVPSTDESEKEVGGETSSLQGDSEETTEPYKPLQEEQSEVFSSEVATMSPISRVRLLGMDQAIQEHTAQYQSGQSLEEQVVLQNERSELRTRIKIELSTFERSREDSPVLTELVHLERYIEEAKDLMAINLLTASKVETMENLLVAAEGELCQGAAKVERSRFQVSTGAIRDELLELQEVSESRRKQLRKEFPFLEIRDKIDEIAEVFTETAENGPYQENARSLTERVIELESKLEFLDKLRAKGISDTNREEVRLLVIEIQTSYDRLSTAADAIRLVPSIDRAIEEGNKRLQRFQAETFQGDFLAEAKEKVIQQARAMIESLTSIKSRTEHLLTSCSNQTAQNPITEIREIYRDENQFRGEGRIDRYIDRMQESLEAAEQVLEIESEENRASLLEKSREILIQGLEKISTGKDLEVHKLEVKAVLRKLGCQDFSEVDRLFARLEEKQKEISESLRKGQAVHHQERDMLVVIDEIRKIVDSLGPIEGGANVEKVKESFRKILADLNQLSSNQGKEKRKQKIEELNGDFHLLTVEAEEGADTGLAKFIRDEIHRSLMKMETLMNNSEKGKGALEGKDLERECSQVRREIEVFLHLI